MPSREKSAHDPSQGNVIYDNENGSADGEATMPSSVLGGGSIVIHKK